MIDLDQCPCSGGTLSKLIQPGILAVLARQPLHGYLIVRRLAGLRMFRGRKPDATGVYRALKAMQKRGLVTSKWDVSEPGPAKHLYRLTRRGTACLARWTRTLRSYRDALDELLRLVKTASRRRRHGRRHRKSTRKRGKE